MSPVRTAMNTQGRPREGTFLGLYLRLRRLLLRELTTRPRYTPAIARTSPRRAATSPRDSASA